MPRVRNKNVPHKRKSETLETILGQMTETYTPQVAVGSVEPSAFTARTVESRLADMSGRLLRGTDDDILPPCLGRHLQFDDLAVDDTSLHGRPVRRMKAEVAVPVLRPRGEKPDLRPLALHQHLLCERTDVSTRALVRHPVEIRSPVRRPAPPPARSSSGHGGRAPSGPRRQVREPRRKCRSDAIPPNRRRCARRMCRDRAARWTSRS